MAVEKGVQRIVLPPGTVAAIHPVGFLVVALNHVYGVPVADEYVSLLNRAGGGLTHQTFGLIDAANDGRAHSTAHHRRRHG